MRKFGLSKMVCIVFAFCAAAVIASPAQTFTTLVNFDLTHGADPQSSLIQGTDGNFYGTTTEGGASGDYGTVFKMTPGGTLTTLYSFCAQTGCPDGYDPIAGLLQATDSNFYGTTTFGGAKSVGTVFKITPGGMLTTLYSFCSQPNCADGYDPFAGLLQATDGNFYGTTGVGGSSGNCSGGCGTVLKITPAGTLTTLHSFDGADGEGPVAGLVQGTDGNFYGTTLNGGSSNSCNSGCGTVFKITPGGTLTTLHSFDFTDGYLPRGLLVQATSGDFYGTTSNGGANFDGTVFKITFGGTLTTLYSFCSQPNCADGYLPSAGLLQASDGNFYGTTRYGGAGANCSGACGTVFKITPAGTLTTLHSFDVTDGSDPRAGLVQATNGSFYGTTSRGGTIGYGTVFSLSVGLPSILNFVPRIGPVGRSVIITGENLTGATSVTFGGVAATSFTVDSDTQIRATVPAGARRGKIGVTTPDGTATSAGIFIVT